MKLTIFILISVVIITGAVFTGYHVYEQKERREQQEELQGMERQRLNRSKIDQITDKMFDICDLAIQLPKDNNEYYMGKMTEIGVCSLGEVSPDTLLARLIALEYQLIKSLGPKEYPPKAYEH
jgi:hypothetical protein